MFSTEATIIGLHSTHQPQCNIFDTRLIESAVVELTDMEGWLYSKKGIQILCWTSLTIQNSFPIKFLSNFLWILTSTIKNDSWAPGSLPFPSLYFFLSLDLFYWPRFSVSPEKKGGEKIARFHSQLKENASNISLINIKSSAEF